MPKNILLFETEMVEFWQELQYLLEALFITCMTWNKELLFFLDLVKDANVAYFVVK